MLEELNLLIELQQIDIELMELEEETGDLPEQIDKLQGEINTFESKLNEAKESLDQTSKERARLKTELEETKNKLNRSQNILYNVKTSREYDAISSEIDQAKVRITEIERQLLEQSARAEEFSSFIQTERSHLELVMVDHSERKSELNERIKGSEDKDSQLYHEREKITMRLKRPVLAHYERIRKLRDGFGVSYIQNDACSYCFSLIPPQRQAEIRKMNDLILCEVCGCVLVSEDHAEKIQF